MNRGSEERGLEKGTAGEKMTNRLMNNPSVPLHYLNGYCAGLPQGQIP